MLAWILLALGGFLGAISRLLVGSLAKGRTRSPFPLGTFLVNVIGSFFLGYFFSASFDVVFSFIGVGFLGAFTTFSTMNVEAVQLWQARRKGIAVFYVISTYVLAILLAFLGFYVGAA